MIIVVGAAYLAKNYSKCYKPVTAVVTYTEENSMDFDMKNALSDKMLGE